MDDVHLLVNPTAGRGRARRALDRIRAALRVRGVEAVELVAPSGAAVPAMVNEARTAGMRRLLIAGGDGLIHMALPALANQPVTVGVVSVGTGNDFARALSLPSTIEAAVHAALGPAAPVDLLTATSDSPATMSATGPSAATDTGPAATGSPATDAGLATTGNSTAQPDYWIATSATGGFSGQVNVAANALRFPRGQQRYTVATLLQLPRLGAHDLTLEIEHQSPPTTAATSTSTTPGGTTPTAPRTVVERRVALVVVANTAFFGGGMAICPLARPDDGLVHVTLIDEVSPWLMGRVLPKVFSGRHVDHPKVSVYSGKRVRLAMDVPFWADGEPLTPHPTRLTLAAAPGALQLAGYRAAPAPTADTPSGPTADTPSDPTATDTPSDPPPGPLPETGRP